MNKIYAGIGSRKTPDQVIKQMMWIGEVLGNKGWTLRSGGADGADLAFEDGCNNVGGLKEIYLPVPKFNKSDSPLFEIPKRAYALAKIYHPTYYGLGMFAKKCMARNVQQVLGPSLIGIAVNEQVDMIICWTPDGAENGEDTTKETGGTGQAIRVATDYEIPVFNLKNEDALDRLTEFLK